MVGLDAEIGVEGVAEQVTRGLDEFVDAREAIVDIAKIQSGFGINEPVAGAGEGVDDVAHGGDTAAHFDIFLFEFKDAAESFG